MTCWVRFPDFLPRHVPPSPAADKSACVLFCAQATSFSCDVEHNEARARRPLVNGSDVFVWHRFTGNGVSECEPLIFTRLDTGRLA